MLTVYVLVMLASKPKLLILTFNDYIRVVIATVTTARYLIANISLEYKYVIQTELAHLIRNQYNTRLPILYDRILRHSKMVVNQRNFLWNITIQRKMVYHGAERQNPSTTPTSQS